MPIKQTPVPRESDSSARMRDGTRIAYTLHSNEDTNARIALVHSLAMDRNFWGPVAARLADSASVLMLDCRGHGASDKPAGPYTIEAFADDLAEVLDQVGWDAAAVAGASMGGGVVLAFAAAYPARVRGLGLIDTTAWYGSDAPGQWAERAQKAIEKGFASMVDFQVTRWFTDAFREAHPEAVQECVDTFVRNDAEAYAETCRMLGACDMRAALPLMRMPAVIVVGREDYATPPAMAEALHEAIAGSSLTVIEDGRHLTPLEHPDRIAAELTRLFEATP